MILENVITKLKLMRRVRANSTRNELKLIFYLIQFSINKKNRKLDFSVTLDRVVYCLVDLESLLIISPRYEDWIWEYLTPKNGDVFVDVGAHIGKYSLGIAKKVGPDGHVFSVEVDPENYAALSAGVRAQPLRKCYVI